MKDVRHAQLGTEALLVVTELVEQGEHDVEAV